MCTTGRMNLFMLLLGVIITMVIMISTNGICSIIAMSLQFIAGNHGHPIDESLGSSKQTEPLPIRKVAYMPTSPINPVSRKFERPCVTFEDCVFDTESGSAGVGGILLLSCHPALSRKSKYCACEHHWGLVRSQAVREWKLSWNATQGICSISEFGPCGWNRGLQIECEEDLKCINGRCRPLAVMGVRPIGASCADNSDCDPSLECSVSANANGLNDYHMRRKICLPRAERFVGHLAK